MWLQRYFRNGWLVALIVGVATVLQGCFGENEIYNPSDYFEKDVEAIEAYIATNNLDVQFDTLNNIYYQVHKQGEGYKGVRSTKVLLHYKGENLEGREFVNTFNGVPQSIYLGLEEREHQYNPANYSWGIDAWVFSKHREGDSISVFLPSYYAFQENGYGIVAPNTPVIYHVKFVDIPKLSEELEDIDQYIDEKAWASEIEPSYGTRYVVHKPGDPNNNIEFGDFITLTYKGSLLDGTVFDSTDVDDTWSITLGQSSVITGFELGLDLLNEGDSATFFIPSIYGYGESSTGNIPVNSTLVFDIVVKSIVR